MQQTKTLFIVEIALFTTLALIFDYLSAIVGLKLWPQGGAISIAMIPIFLMAFRWGLKGGMLSGLLLGVLQIATGQAFIAHPVQGFLEYFVAFSLLGAAGLLVSQVEQAVRSKDKKKALWHIAIGTFLGCLLRFLSHFIAGIVFFKEYAPEETPVVIYSLVYNISYMLPSWIISVIFVYFLVQAIPTYFYNNKY